MAKKKAKVKRSQKRIEPPGKCSFCEQAQKPSYKKYKVLQKFLSDRAKILGKDRTGVCSKHQRELSSEIKKARHLGLLPFRQSI